MPLVAVPATREIDANSAIEMACVDLTARSLGVPVYSYLGGAVKDRLLFNAWIGILPPDEAARDPLPFSNIVYALHFYASTHHQAQRDVAAAALKSGVALFATEFGTSKADGGGQINVEETRKWWKFLEENQISWCNWSIADKIETAAALIPGASPDGTA